MHYFAVVGLACAQGGVALIGDIQGIGGRRSGPAKQYPERHPGAMMRVSRFTNKNLTPLGEYF